MCLRLVGFGVVGIMGNYSSSHGTCQEKTLLFCKRLFLWVNGVAASN